MVEYCNKMNIEFLVPEELINNFTCVVQQPDQKNNTESLFKAYPTLFQYLKENDFRQQINKSQTDQQILDYITKPFTFSEKDIPKFVSSEEINTPEKKLINQIFFPNRNLRTPLHILYSGKKLQLLEDIKSFLLENSDLDNDLNLVKKQFEYIYKYHLEYDMVDINIYSKIKCLFDDFEFKHLTKEQKDTIDFYEEILNEIKMEVKNELKDHNWKSYK